MRINAKITLALLMTAIIPILILTYIGYNGTKDILNEHILTLSVDEVDKHSTDISITLRDVDNDVLLVSKVPPMQGLVSARIHGGLDSKYKTSYDSWRARLGEMFTALTETNSAYLQIRYIDEDGQEIVRVDRRDGTITVMLENELQNKKENAYFTETMRLPKGEVYVSELNLNKEFGKVEVPYKPVIRFATPIYDENGDKRGIAIINVDARSFLQTLDEGDSLLTKDGHYAFNAKKEKEWGGPSDLNTGEGFRKDFPEISAQVLSGKSGTVMAEGTMFTYSPAVIDPSEGDFAVVVKTSSLETAFAPLDKLLRDRMLLLIMTVLVVLIVSFFMSKTLTNPIKKLTNIIEDISTGNLDVEIDPRIKDSKDEIGSLAKAFDRTIVSLKLAMKKVGNMPEKKEEEKK